MKRRGCSIRDGGNLIRFILICNVYDCFSSLKVVLLGPAGEHKGSISRK